MADAGACRKGAGRIIAALIALAVFAGGCAPTYRVVRVIDGDTIVVEDAGGIRTRVRLRRVNAPELDEPGGLEAKRELEQKLLGRRVRLHVYAHDKYGRAVGTVK